MNLLDLDKMQVILQRPCLLTKQITHRLHERYSPASIFSSDGIDLTTAAAVLFLLGQFPGQGRLAGKPCLILNKRSVNVRQPGDLCCPGGGVNLYLDGVLAKLLKLSILPLARWPYWAEWLKLHPRRTGWLRLLLATGLRESVEEIRLNPAQYACFRLRIETRSSAVQINTFPCFRYAKETETELLWGATYRITMVFLKDVFGFVPPAADSLPQIHGRLSRSY